MSSLNNTDRPNAYISHLVAHHGIHNVIALPHSLYISQFTVFLVLEMLIASDSVEKTAVIQAAADVVIFYL